MLRRLLLVVGLAVAFTSSDAVAQAPCFRAECPADVRIKVIQKSGESDQSRLMRQIAEACQAREREQWEREESAARVRLLDAQATEARAERNEESWRKIEQEHEQKNIDALLQLTLRHPDFGDHLERMVAWSKIIALVPGADPAAYLDALYIVATYSAGDGKSVSTAVKP